MGNKTINNEVKACIFSLYFNQPIGKDVRDSSFTYIVDVGFLNSTDSFAYLQVNPLSSISEEVANIILIIEGQLQNQPIEFKETKNSIFYSYGYGSNKVFLPLSTQSIDYLRANGYAVRYLCHSVDDLITAGVFKINDNI